MKIYRHQIVKIYIVLITSWIPRFIGDQEFYDKDTIIDEVFDTEEKAKERKFELDKIYKQGNLTLVGIVEREIEFKTEVLTHQTCKDEDAIKSESLKKFNECVDAAVARYSYTDL